MAHEDGQRAGDDRMDLSYIDRLVFEVENNGEEDDSSLDLMSESGSSGEDSDGEGESDEGEGGDKNEAGDGDNNNNNDDAPGENNDSGEEYCEESSDDEFEYDSDEDTSVEILEKNYTPTPRNPVRSISEEGKALLLWREEKKASYSDWSIEVTVSKGGKDAKTIYNVHRSTLAAGPKKSGYFDTLFQSEQFKESDNSTSKVTLSEDVAGCFSDFLDYIYSPPNEGTCFIDKANWRSLHYLADYFLVPKLSDDVIIFLEEDVLNLRHLEEYMSGFAGSDDCMPKFLIALATRACAKMILSIEEDSSLLTLIPPAMFLHIFTLLRSSNDIMSLSSDKQYQICRLAVKYFQTHQSNLDSKYFDALTRELYFPNDMLSGGTMTSAAGLLAIDLLEIIKLSGWEMEKFSIFLSCNAILSRYLTDYNFTPSEIDVIVEKIPFHSISIVLSEVLNVKRFHKDRDKRIKDISCKIMLENFAVPKGTVVSIGDVKPTDSINYIRYLVDRRLNGRLIDFNLARKSGIELFFRGCELADGNEMVSAHGIRSKSVLEIKESCSSEKSFRSWWGPAVFATSI